MIRRLALTAGFAVLGAVAFAPSASAQVADDETVPFSGSVGSSCALTLPTPGILALTDTDNPTTLSSDSSEAVGGQSGTVTVNCNSSSTIVTSVNENPEVPEDFIVEDATSTVTLSSSDAGFTSTATGGSLTSSNTDVPVDVDLKVASTAPLPAGTYTYDVTVTATPD